MEVSVVVLELVEYAFAAQLTIRSTAPTLGIGSGESCDGQILVTHDLLGAFPWFRPKFVQPRMESAELTRQAVRAWWDDWDTKYTPRPAPSPEQA